jgi:hypothetical protein
MTSNDLWPLAPVETMLDPDTITRNVEEKSLALAGFDRRTAEIRDLRARLTAAKLARENQTAAESILADVVPVVNRNGFAVGYMTGDRFALTARLPSKELDFGYYAPDMDADVVGRLAGLIHGHGWMVARLWVLPVGTTARTVEGGIKMFSGPLGERDDRADEYLKAYKHTVIVGTPPFVASTADGFLGGWCDFIPRTSAAGRRFAGRAAVSVLLAVLARVLCPWLVGSPSSFVLATALFLAANYLLRSWAAFPLVALLPAWLARRWRPSLDRYRTSTVSNRFIDRLADRIGRRTALWYWRPVAPIGPDTNPDPPTDTTKRKG